MQEDTERLLSSNGLGPEPTSYTTHWQWRGVSSRRFRCSHTEPRWARNGRKYEEEQ